MSELFDRLAKLAAAGGSRRDALKYLGGFLAGGFLAASPGKARADDDDDDDDDDKAITAFCQTYCKPCQALTGGAFEHCFRTCKHCKEDNGTLCGVCSSTNRVVTCCRGKSTCCIVKGVAPYCANLNKDVKNCGACAKVCTSTVAKPQGCCSGKCTDLTTTTNCGRCGHACESGQKCVQSSTTKRYHCV
jgi:hypothetical protein